MPTADALDQDTDAPVVSEMDIGPITEKRVADADRRSADRRRSARGLFEIRARRERVDRRRIERRGGRRFRLAFWRKPE